MKGNTSVLGARAGRTVVSHSKTMESIKRKKPRKYYTAEQVSAALEAINGGMTINEASKTFSIPKTTLRDKRDEKYKHKTCGVQPVLTKDEEKELVDWILNLGHSGFQVTKETLIETVSKFVQTLNRPNPFKNGIPGRYWFDKFMKRHPVITKGVPESFPSSENEVAKAIRSWFDWVSTIIMENDLQRVFEDPRRIFTCDEVGFFLLPKKKQVLVRRDSSRVHNHIENDDKECLTVLVNVSGDGDIAPTMIVYPYKDLPKSFPTTLPYDWAVGNTESGWMNTETFFEYITNHFYSWLLRNDKQLPVVLFLDRHFCHISLELTAFCKEKGIFLIAQLPHSTPLLQPLDVAVFRPVKDIWLEIVKDYKETNNAVLNRTDFAAEVKRCFDKCLKPEVIRSGFRFCSLYPFDPNKIDYTKLLSKITNTENMIVVETLPKMATDDFKKEFEGRLSPVTLQMFQISGDQWTGDPSYEKLFDYWKKIDSTCETHDEYKEFEANETKIKIEDQS